MILGIDTATRFASIALYHQGQVLAEHTWRSRDHHTVELMPNLVRMLEGQGLRVADLTGLAVALGPGSFTGLRIGLSTAKGLAMASDLPVAGVPTLDVIAYAQAHWSLPLWAVIQAGRARICAAFYPLSGPWPGRDDYHLTTLDALVASVLRARGACSLSAPTKENACEVEGPGPVLICGEIDGRQTEALRQRLGQRAIVAPGAAALRRAGYLAELASDRLQRGEGDDLVTLSPIYLQVDSRQ